MRLPESRFAALFANASAVPCAQPGIARVLGETVQDAEAARGCCFLKFERENERLKKARIFALPASSISTHWLRDYVTAAGFVELAITTVPEG